jgi:glycosyltransferase involved in cell wall biosynthesis
MKLKPTWLISGITRRVRSADEWRLRQGMFKMKNILRQFRFYRFSAQMKSALRRTIAEFPKADTRYRCDTILPKTRPRGAVLVSYYNTIGRERRPAVDFLRDPTKPLPEVHHMEWMSLQIIRTFLNMGYEVDLISWTNDCFVPKRPYSAFVDVRHNMERLAPLLNKDCIKVLHIDLCHMLYNNYAEARRLLELQQRRGVTLQVRRSERPNLGIENADCATIIGNEFAIKTFAYAQKPLYRVPVTCNCLYPAPDTKDYDASRKNFLWIGSAGFVRKGLDLVLEAFSAMPDFNLSVCGSIDSEPDFQQAFYKELYETPNIHRLHWVDISGAEFADLVSKCVGFVYPSCSEAQCGAVVGCLHAGLIPIVSYESDVPVDGFGIMLVHNSVQEIQAAVRTISSLPAPELQRMARKAWDYARSYHTRDNFAEEYQRVIEELMATQGANAGILPEKSALMKDMSREPKQRVAIHGSSSFTGR